VIRTEPVLVAAVRADPQLRNVFAFTWNLADPENTVSALAVVRAEVEDRHGRISRLLLRAGQAYEYADPAARVWLTCTAPGLLVLDVAYDEGDRLTPTPPAPPEPTSYEDAVVVLPEGYVIDTGNGTEVAVFEKPAWKPKGAAVWTHNGGIDPFRNWSGAIEHLIVQQFTTGPRLLTSGWQALPDTTGSAAFGYEQGVALLAVYGSGTEPGNGNFQAGPTHPRVPSPPPARIVVRLRGSSAPRTVQPGKTANIFCQWWR
jgi:hypothetical protein